MGGGGHEALCIITVSYLPKPAFTFCQKIKKKEKINVKKIKMERKAQHRKDAS